MFNKLYNKPHKTQIPRPSGQSNPRSNPPGQLNPRPIPPSQSKSSSGESKQPATKPNSTCPDCGSNLELPPSLESLLRSEKVQYITIDISLDRTIPLCKNCARSLAQTTGSTISLPASHLPIQESILSRLQQTNDLIYNPDLDEPTKARLKLAKPKLEELLQQSKKEERELAEYWELRGQMTKTIDLIGQGVYPVELGRVLDIQKERSDSFQKVWEKKGWMGYWAIWGWSGEMKLDS